MPRSRIAIRNPRLAMTVTTTVSPVSFPRFWRSPAQMAMIWSPSTTAPLRVDEHDAVGVAVERDADVRLASDDLVLQVGRVGRAAAAVDVGAVGFRMDHIDAHAERRQDPRRDHRGGAVRAVDDGVDPGERC